MSAEAPPSTDLERLAQRFPEALQAHLRSVGGLLGEPQYVREVGIRAWEQATRLRDAATRLERADLSDALAALAHSLALAVRDREGPTRTLKAQIELKLEAVSKLAAVQEGPARAQAPLVLVHDPEGRLLDIEAGLQARGARTLMVADPALLESAVAERRPRVLVLVPTTQSPESRVALAERIGKTMKREKLDMAMLVIADEVDLGERLALLRAGIAAHVKLGTPKAEVLIRIQDLLAEPELEPYRVLIVDDDRAQSMIVDVSLRRAGCTTLVTNRAWEAMSQLHDFAPDVVIVDLHMPEINGLELTRLIREQSQLAHVQVLFVTGEQDFGARVDAIRTGGDDYLVKPVQPQYLIALTTTRARRARALKFSAVHQAQRSIFVDRLMFEVELDQISTPDEYFLGLIEFNDGGGLRAAELLRWHRRIEGQTASVLGSDQSATWVEGGQAMLLLFRSADLGSAQRHVGQVAGQCGGEHPNDVRLVGHASARLTKAPLGEQLIKLREQRRSLAEPVTPPAPKPVGGLPRDLRISFNPLRPSTRMVDARPLVFVRAGIGDGASDGESTPWSALKRGLGSSPTDLVALDDQIGRSTIDMLATHADVGAALLPQTLAYMVEQGTRSFISRVLDKGVAPERIVILVSGDDVLAWPKQGRSCLDELADHGFQIGIAQFGDTLVSQKLIEFVRARYATFSTRLLQRLGTSGPVGRSATEALEGAQRAGLQIVFPARPAGLPLAQAFTLGADWVAGD